MRKGTTEEMKGESSWVESCKEGHVGCDWTLIYIMSKMQGLRARK
jgi:mRNA-degrading endonuclease YafQ of YafQ-DinJ toxin-antitoxin module